jgi:ribonuclease HI
MKSKKYYAVLKGRKTGIFTTWDDCKKQVEGFSNAIYKSFKTKEEAEEFLGIQRQGVLELVYEDSKKQESNPIIIYSDNLIIESICVDASCKGNPGDVEYRGVETKTRNEIFRLGTMANGTNNLGEFLAIVHGLAYLKKNDREIPVYSDSETGILWVKNKHVKTKLIRSTDNEEIFRLVDRALIWLNNNNYNNPIFKWDTVQWGEIPADFGRK